jgi:hypothetical protein
MAAPRFSPVSPTEHPRYYASPDHVPEQWMPDRPGDIEGFQPDGPRLGEQGPDQGYALHLAAQLRPKVQLQPGEHIDDVIRGCLGVALRRASMFSRAPVVHDLTIAFTIWGFYDADPPSGLVELRRTMFEGLRLVGHHYMEARAVADLPPDATLRMTPAQVAAAYPAEWETLVGA